MRHRTLITALFFTAFALAGLAVLTDLIRGTELDLSTAAAGLLFAILGESYRRRRPSKTASS